MGDHVKTLSAELQRYKSLHARTCEKKTRANCKKKMKYQELKNDPEKIEEYEEHLQKQRKKSLQISKVGKDIKKNLQIENQNNARIKLKLVYENWKKFETDVLMNTCFKSQIENSIQKLSEVWNAYWKLTGTAKQLCEDIQKMSILKSGENFISLFEERPEYKNMRKNLQAARLNCEQIGTVLSNLKRINGTLLPMPDTIDDSEFLTMDSNLFDKLKHNCALLLDSHSSKVEKWTHVENWVPEKLSLIEIKSEDLEKWEKKKQADAKYRMNKKRKLSDDHED